MVSFVLFNCLFAFTRMNSLSAQDFIRADPLNDGKLLKISPIVMRSVLSRVNSLLRNGDSRSNDSLSTVSRMELDQASITNTITTLSYGIGIINSVAGNGSLGLHGNGGPATSATLSARGVAVDVLGNFYIADTGNNCIRMVTKSTGIISAVAGTGVRGDSGDGGPAILAELTFPFSVAVDASGNVYMIDAIKNRVRMVTKSTGIITTVAGTGGYGYTGDGGPAKSATLAMPFSVAVDASGNIYIADYGNYRIRMVTKSTGIITTVAGIGPHGYSGDGGPATSAGLGDSYGVAVGVSGNVYISDNANNRIRMVTKSTGIITTVAGNWTAIYKGDGGPATSAGLYRPYGIAVDASENIYIADFYNKVIRMVTKSTGIITTVAGNGAITGYGGDGGPATSASLRSPLGVAIDASGCVYIADYGSSRIRMFSLSAAPTAAPAASGIGSSTPTASPSLSVPSAGVAPSAPPSSIRSSTPTALPSLPTPTIAGVASASPGRAVTASAMVTGLAYAAAAIMTLQ